jgi:mRNA-degrading endonuclease RelE of RelBE toxin-antitoxin system
VKKLQDIDPPEYRLRVGDYRVRFALEKETMLVLRVRNRREAYRWQRTSPCRLISPPNSTGPM